MTREQTVQFGLFLALAAWLAGWWTHDPLFDRLCPAALVLTALCPCLYTPLAFAWYALARRLERFFSVILLAVLFYGVLTPVGCLRRWLGKDTWRLRQFGKGTESVFTVRDHPYQSDDLEHQY